MLRWTLSVSEQMKPSNFAEETCSMSKIVPDLMKFRGFGWWKTISFVLELWFLVCFCGHRTRFVFQWRIRVDVCANHGSYMGHVWVIHGWYGSRMQVNPRTSERIPIYYHARHVLNTRNIVWSWLVTEIKMATTKLEVKIHFQHWEMAPRFQLLPPPHIFGHVRLCYGSVDIIRHWPTTDIQA